MHSSTLVRLTFAFVLVAVVLAVAWIDRAGALPAAVDASAPKMKFCGSKFDTWMNKVCTFGNEPNSCLKNEIRIEDRLRAQCCDGGGCTLDELKELCCFTDACLAQCYPGKGYKMGGVY